MPPQLARTSATAARRASDIVQSKHPGFGCQRRENPRRCRAPKASSHRSHDFDMSP
jgi:hypothetical protein